MTNQGCKVRPQIVSVNRDDPVFFPFSIKTSKCSGSCNYINNPCAKLCVPDVAKKVNVKLFNLVWGSNETRRIESHETCKCKCRFNSSVCNNNLRWNDDKCKCKCKELINKGVCDKGIICNPSNREGECYKFCDFSEFLDHKSCKCEKGLADKLAEQCTENIDETRLIEIISAKNENKHRCHSCTLYAVHIFNIFYN